MKRDSFTLQQACVQSLLSNSSLKSWAGMSASTETSSSSGACVRSGAKLIATNTEVADMLNGSALVNGLGRHIEVLECHDISRHHVVLLALVNVVLGEEVVHRYRELQGRYKAP